MPKPAILYVKRLMNFERTQGKSFISILLIFYLFQK